MAALVATSEPTRLQGVARRKRRSRAFKANLILGASILALVLLAILLAPLIA